MTEKTVMDALVQMKRTGNLLNEVEDLTKQLGEAIDRNDQVSLELLIAMREEPLGRLQEADRAIRDQLELLTDRLEAAQLASMLGGGLPADSSVRVQQQLCEQVAANNRHLKRIIELDRVRTMVGELRDSFREAHKTTMQMLAESAGGQQ